MEKILNANSLANVRHDMTQVMTNGSLYTFFVPHLTCIKTLTDDLSMKARPTPNSYRFDLPYLFFIIIISLNCVACNCLPLYWMH